ncbi:queuosine salvage family protein [Conexibacter sp. DBS9H8]|uniref:queuosine salvage family protein n=1 Tax=Conexibacter sp. DBS9H8 TaxID=2937801 RepID=UPI00200BE014|nr:queuosine salvage family protein [Conexibacter sp. DBS9H8]
MVVNDLREAAAWVTAQARHVHLQREQVPLYAATLPTLPTALPVALGDPARRREVALYWLTLDAINFGSGWFPTLRKLPGATGYGTVAGGLARRWDERGPWSVEALASLRVAEVAATFGQDPGHELMALFCASLNDLGAHLDGDWAGDPLALLEHCAGSAVTLVELLAPWWSFADVSTYAGRPVPFLKRAQIAAADLHRAGVVHWDDLAALTMFADNLVPHVLRLDGILTFTPELVARIDAETLIAHDSTEEIEIRAAALCAVELMVAALGGSEHSPVTAAEIDQLLWQRGQSPLYKRSPRHRSRCRAY